MFIAISLCCVSHENKQILKELRNIIIAIGATEIWQLK